MGVRRVGPPPGGSENSSTGNINRPRSTGNFSQILAQKEPSTTRKTKDLSEPEVKAEMSALLRDGGDSRKLVLTALRNHPLVRELPSKTQEKLFVQVSSTIKPFLRGV